jgi:flagellin
VAVKLGSNIQSLTAQRRLSDNSAALSKTFERLSSGLRINRAVDDAAGLAIANSLNTDSRIFNQGIRNFNDGISLLNIADGAIENLSGITIRLKELAEQSSNGTYGVQQRKAMDSEAQALSKEYSRIVQSTTFNGRQLFTGGVGDLRLQGGYGTDGGIQSNLGGAIGTGSFTNVITYDNLGGAAGGAGNSHGTLALGDINGDGIQDMVSGQYFYQYGFGDLQVRIGRGDGTFQNAATYDLNLFGSQLTLGDVNGDGNLDMVAVGYYNTINKNAFVMLGNGNGTFAAALSSNTTSSGASSVTLGDLNGDGALDLVYAGYPSNNSTVSVQLGNGNGYFATSTQYSFNGSDRMKAVTLGDINGDGILDIASQEYYTGSTYIMLGRGNGSFSSSTSYTGLAHGYGVALGDINSDGNLDLISSGSVGGVGKVYTRLGNGSGTFGTATSYSYGIGDIHSPVLADFNGDGFMDIAAGGLSSGFVNTSILFTGKGNGTFNAASSFAMIGSSVAALVAGDLNGDGVYDLVAANYSQTQNNITVQIARTTSGTSSLLNFKLTTRADSRQALSQFTSALNRLSAQRGTIGAFQSRLNVGTRVLQASSENYKAAESRIKDVDVAQESSELVRRNILQKASAAVLAQANQQPALALKLLRSG